MKKPTTNNQIKIYLILIIVTILNIFILICSLKNNKLVKDISTQLYNLELIDEN